MQDYVIFHTSDTVILSEFFGSSGWGRGTDMLMSVDLAWHAKKCYRS